MQGILLEAERIIVAVLAIKLMHLFPRKRSNKQPQKTDPKLDLI
jgi:hypothetical protein